MGIGFLTVQARIGSSILPVANARVIIKRPDGTALYETQTNANGNTERYSLTAPDMAHTLDMDYMEPAYSVCDVEVSAAGFMTTTIRNVEIVDTKTSILPVCMSFVAMNSEALACSIIIIPPKGLLLDEPDEQAGPPDVRMPEGEMPDDAVIPDYINVHLGRPDDAAAKNVRVRFTDYVKNVASSGIYPTWPQSSLVANVHAIVTYALNRIHTEWYRSNGYNFDITNSIALDQYYRNGGPVFENISRIVDGIFNIYARRAGFINPFFTQSCSGSAATCAGLSQWGTVMLANQGMSPIQILRHHYPEDLELVISDNIAAVSKPYPGTPLRLGSRGDSVRRIQNNLNRIGESFPLIPRISNPDGVFCGQTQEAVRVFQRTFALTSDGIAGRETWNKLFEVHRAVESAASPSAQASPMPNMPAFPGTLLKVGSTGQDVWLMQNYLNTISDAYPSIPKIGVDSIFGEQTRRAVTAFQREFMLTEDGIIGPATWNKIMEQYATLSGEAAASVGYPGTPLRRGSTGDSVRLIQDFLSDLRETNPGISPISTDGIFGPNTEEAVKAFQRSAGLAADGIVGPSTWNALVNA